MFRKGKVRRSGKQRHAGLRFRVCRGCRAGVYVVIGVSSAERGLRVGSVTE